MMSPEFEARLDRERGYRERAWRIVNRLLPELPSAHGFYDPLGFIEASRRRGDRNFLQWMIFARLRAKVEGGEQRIDLPRDCEHSLGGSAMWRASKALEADPVEAWERLRNYVSIERTLDKIAA